MDAWRQKIDMELDLRLLILMELDLWFVIRKNIVLVVFVLEEKIKLYCR